MKKTNDFLSMIQKLQPDFDGMVEQSIQTKDHEKVGWHCYAYLKNGVCIGNGTHARKEIARRIAIAECLERAVFYKMCKDVKKQEVKDVFLLKGHPTTCGFAVGFKDENTKWRAVCESLERWAWSKWIDEHFFLPEISVPSGLFSQLSNTLRIPFDRIQCYQKKMTLFIEKKLLSLNFNVFLGFKDKGVFPGSRVTPEQEDQWDHCVIEAWRNCNNFEMYQRKSPPPPRGNSIIDRIMYFGENAQKAMESIACSKQEKWPSPQMELLRPFSVPEDAFYVWRCLMKDYVPWDQGSKDRFVY